MEEHFSDDTQPRLVSVCRPAGSSVGAALALCMLAPGAALAQSDLMIGKWRLAVDMGPNVDYGILEIERQDEELRVYVDGGPVNLLELDGDSFRFDMDWTDGGDRLHVTELSGRRTAIGFTGETSENGELNGSWTAEPFESRLETGPPPEPADIFGVWVNLSRGTHKDRFDLNETGQALDDAYDSSLDDPHLRCVSGGVVRMEDGPMAYEIIERDDHILILYEYFHEVRRVWMDGREFPEGTDDAWLSMGYSIGHWEGDTLVVETRGMRPTVWDANGMPISSSAVVREYKYLDEQGRLHTEMTVEDPAHYNRPLYRHLYRERRDDVQLAESACDPHAFYRSLHLEGRLEEYWERSGNRF